MGTKVQSKMYLPGYYSTNEHLGNSAGYGVCPLHNENKSLRNGQHFDMLLAPPMIDGFHVDKEQLRQTILKQETIFRQQVRELHRVYKIQRDMMNEVRRTEEARYLVCEGATQSTLFSPDFQSKDDSKSWHVSDLPLPGSSCRRPSRSGIDVMQSCYNALKGKAFESSCASDLYDIKSTESTDQVSLDFKCKKRQRILIDLERPPDEYFSDGKELEREHEMSRGANFLFNKGNDVSHYRGEDLFNHGGDSTGLTSGLHLERTMKLIDLNEPIGIEEKSAADAVIDLCNETFSKKELEKSAISANNAHLEQERNRTETFEAAKIRKEKSSSSGNFHCADFQKPCESSKIESSKTNEVAVSDTSKAKKQMKESLFGVEISGMHDDVLTLDYKGHDHQTVFVPQSHMDSYELSSSSSWGKIPSSLKQNPKGAHRDIGYDTSVQSNEGSSLLPPISQVTGEKLHGICNSKSTPSLKSERFNLNDVCFGSQSESNDLQACQTPMSLGFSSHVSHNGENFAKYNPEGSFSGIHYVEGEVPSKGMKDAAIPNQYPCEVICKENVISIGEQRKQERSQEVIFCPSATQRCKTSGEESSESLKIKFDSLNGNTEQLLNRKITRKGLLQCNIQDSASATQGNATEHKNVEISDCSSIKKILGFPMDSSPAKTSCLGFINSIKPALEKGDLTCHSASTRSEDREKVEGPNVGKNLINDGTDLKHPIDLNICLTDEESQLIPTSPILKAKIEIDLETPAVDETEIESTTRGDSLESKYKESFDSLDNEISLPHSFAAEALVAMSSSHTNDLPDNAVIDLQENGSDSSLSDTLHWLADIISSFKGVIDNEAGVKLKGCSAFNESLINNDDIDYFEYMTLMLKESKVEQYFYKPLHVDNLKEEEVLPKRPRKGQTRRGRQRKDFQRDVLPSITSLSRNEVTEDIQIIEGLIRAMGGTWQSSLTQRKAGRGGGRRGRKRGGGGGGGSSLSPPVTAVCESQVQQSNCKEPGLEERALGGWGKRTRRPPRQRYPITNAPVALK